MTMMRIRLELARTEGYPEGDAGQGYEFVAPLDGNGRIDAEAWCKAKSACTVQRFEAGFAVRRGLVRHVGQGWRYDYDHMSSQDDEAFFRLDRHVLAPGCYVSIREPNGTTLPYRVVSVQLATVETAT